MSKRCTHCGKTWERDPRLEVPCPTCESGVGVKCKRPSGHACEPHIPREQKAIDEGHYEEDCPGVPDDK